MEKSPWTLHCTSSNSNIDVSKGDNGQRTLDMSLMLVKFTHSRTGGRSYSGKDGENAGFYRGTKCKTLRMLSRCP